MLSILIQLIQWGSLTIIMAYVLMSTRILKTAMLSRYKFRSQVILFIALGAFAVFSNMVGVVIIDGQVMAEPPLFTLSPGASLANSRVLSISVSGLVGGPVVGIAVGLVSGVFRYFQGGLTPHIYLLSSLVIGALSGLAGNYSMRREEFPHPLPGAVFAAGMELIQMGMILLLSTDTQASWELVRMIIIPMVLVNSIGAGLFLSIIRSTIEQEVATRAVQTHRVLDLTNETLPYFSMGLTKESAQQISQLIMDAVDVSAVSITNRSEVLSYIGAGADHHFTGSPVQTDLTLRVFEEGKEQFAHSRHEIGCHQPNCPLNAAVIVPLKTQNETIGAMKFYFTDSHKMTELEERMAIGLAQVFSMQIQLGQIQKQKDLLQAAELKNLQTQVNPHFFFNAMNTISAIMRTDSDKARDLLLNLSDYFRASLKGHHEPTLTLQEEMKHVTAYLEIEEARFPNRVAIHWDIDPETLAIKIPPFTLQVLVENAMRHAFRSKDQEQPEINIQTRIEDNNLMMTVEDNGQGIEPERLEILGDQPLGSEKGTGTALYNLKQRILGLYQDQGQFNIQSQVGQGTLFTLKIPNKEVDYGSLTRG